MMPFVRSLTLAVLSAFAFAVAGPSFAAADGEMWEVTTQMAMEGMPAGMGMPASTRQVCTAKEWNKPPVNNERGCQFSDFQRTATKATWKMSCDGMSGDGEITRTSPDAYKGWMKMSMPQGSMTMNLSGRRLGACDTGEANAKRDAQAAKMEAQMAAGQKVAGDAMKQICSMGAQGLDLRSFHMNEELCTGPQGGFTAASYKVPFCDKAKTYDGFKMACPRDADDSGNNLDAVAKFCGTTRSALAAAACPQAKKSEDLDVLADCCPNEAKAYAAEHCAGLSYSGAGALGGFCATFAKDLMDGAGKSGR